MIHAQYQPMPKEPMLHYLLSPYEVELLTIFRQLSPSGQALVANVIASQYTPACRELIKPVELTLVKKGA